MLRIFHSHYIYKLLLFLLILLGLVFSSFTSFAQCTVANNFISGSTNGLTITDVGQSFRMRVSGASCGNGEITSITIFNFSNNSDITLRIYEGEGFSGNVAYTQTGISSSVGSPTTQTIDLTTPFPYSGGRRYTFRLTSDNTFQLAKSTLVNPYSDGQLYENGSAVSNEDLFFTIRTNLSGGLVPVDLAYFRAEKREKEVYLEWETESEEDNEGFYIERSQDSQNWTSLGFVKGHGTTSTPKFYQFFDENPLIGQSYYRLKQWDYDGNFEYSKVEAVNFSIEADLNTLNLFPNPVERGETLTINGISEVIESMIIYNSLGQRVGGKALEKSHSVQLNGTEFPGSGWYTIVFTGGNQSVAKKVLFK